MSAASVNRGLPKVSAITPFFGSTGSDTNLCLAPRKRQYGCRSREQLMAVKINLFDSLTYDVCGGGTSRTTASPQCLLKRDASPCMRQQDCNATQINMFGDFLPAGHPGTRGLVWYRKTDDGFVEDYRVPDFDYSDFVDPRAGPAKVISTLDRNSPDQLCDGDKTPNKDSECKTSSTPSEDVDGQVCALGLKLIKSAVVVILQHIVNNKLKEMCLGCEVNHPSQLRHSCLFEPDEFFFEKYYADITRTLFTPGLKTALAGLLKCFGIQLPLQKIQECAETVALDFQHEPFIVEKLQTIREYLIDQASEPFVADAFDCWKTGSKTISAI